MLSKFNLSSPNFAIHFPAFLTDNPIYRSDNARKAFFAIGVSFTLFKVLSYAKSILSPLFQFRKDLTSRYGKNSWAVITGSAEGVGRAFAYELASREFNIVLVDRNEPLLKEVDQDLRQMYPNIQTRMVIADFADSSEPGWAEKLYEQVNDLDISILVNNAGVRLADYYHKLRVNDIRNLVLINALAHALIIRVFLPKLLARKKKCAIINQTSLAAAIPKPFEQIYSATKAFHDFLSRGLVYEYPNIDIISIKPGPICTKMINYQKPGFNRITPEDFVKTTLSLMGWTSESYGHWRHKLDSWHATILPEWLKPVYFKKRFGIKD